MSEIAATFNIPDEIFILKKLLHFFFHLGECKVV